MSRAVSVPASKVRVDLGDGAGLVERECSSWRVSRSLSGGGLPGQVRAVSGSSVGSGSVTIPVDPGSPWPGVTPGGPVEIDVTHDVETLVDGGMVGWREACRMRTRSVSWDSWLSPVRSVSLEDEVPRGPVVVPIDLERSDACCVVERAANAAGLRSTPPPAASAAIAVPMVGASWAERGPDWVLTPGRFRSNSMGVAMLTDSNANHTPLPVDPESGVFGLAPAGQLPAGFAVAFTVALFSYEPDAPPLFALARIGLSPTSTAIEVSADGSGDTWLKIYPQGQPPVSFPLSGRLAVDGWPARIVVTWEASSSNTWSGDWRVYVNGEPVGSPYSYSTTLERGSGLRGVSQLRATEHSGLGGLQIGTSLDPLDYGLLGRETALVGASGSPLEAIIEPTSGDAWAIIQDVARATLGAAWIDERGRLVYRGREALRTGPVVAEVDALDRLEDIPGAVSLDEVADRVEVTYRPAVTAFSLLTDLTILDIDEVLAVNAGATVSITRDLDVAAARLGRWWRPWEDTSPPERWCRYAAWTAPPGESGSAPPSDALDVSARLITPTRIRITIRNTTSARLWVYRLVARADFTVRAGAAVTLAAGVSEREARNPLSLDLGAWVQSGETARAILAWLAGETSSPQPVLSDIRIDPDTDLMLGDTVLVRIDSMSGDPADAVTLKALISGVDLSHTPGDLSQSVSLTVLAMNVGDFNERFSGRTVADFNAEFAGMTVGDLNRLITIGGLL